MSTLSITQSWGSGEVAFEADLDNIRDAVTTFVNTTKFGDDNIRPNGITAYKKFHLNSVTRATLAARASATSATSSQVMQSASSGTYTNTTTTASSVGLEANLTTLGGPILIGLVPDQSSSDSYIGLTGATAATTVTATIRLFMSSISSPDATDDINILTEYTCKIVQPSAATIELLVPPGGFMTFIPEIPAGTYYFSVGASVTGTATTKTISIYRCKLFAMEL